MTSRSEAPRGVRERLRPANNFDQLEGLYPDISRNALPEGRKEPNRAHSLKKGLEYLKHVSLLVTDGQSVSGSSGQPFEHKSMRTYIIYIVSLQLL